MARTQWGIVYGTANPHVRRHILPDDDSELNDPRLVGPGEKLIKVPIVQSEDSPTFLARIGAAVCQDAGVAQLSDMIFAEIDETNTVVMIHVGDAALYSGPNTYINVSRAVFPGCTYNPLQNNFTTPQVILPAKPGVRAVSIAVPPSTVT